MSTPILSVVIPTRDRRERLAETVAAIGDQGLAPGEVEVIVVDDGSRDPPPNLSAPATTLRVLRQDARGPAAARNLGIAAASAPRVLLLGDDTRPAPGTLAAHLGDTGGRDIGVQGHIDWDPRAPVTPVMRFLAPAGPQFYFKKLVDGAPIPYTAVLGSNLSAPRQWFLDDPYDETFPDAAFEDTELAYRWRRRGRQAVYAAGALCWHRHHYDRLEPFLARQRRAGRAARHGVRKQPGMFLDVIAGPLLFGVFALARHAARRAMGRGRREDAWDLRCRSAFLKGLLSR